MYTCKRCGYNTPYKSNLKSHLKRKNVCVAISENIPVSKLLEELSRRAYTRNVNTAKFTPQTVVLPESDETGVMSSFTKVSPLIDLPPNLVNKIAPAEAAMESHRGRKIELITREKTREGKPRKKPYTDLCGETKMTKNREVYYQTGRGKQKRYFCGKCHKSYSKNSNLHRHMRKCLQATTVDLVVDDDNSEMTVTDRNIMLKKENQLIKQQNQLIIKEKKLIKQERDALKREIETMLVNFGKNINNNISMTQNIIINSYGNENIEYLSKGYLNSLLKIPYFSIQKLLKDIHFNPSHPENHNIKIPNRKEKFAIIYNNGRWNYTNKRDVIENMVDKSYNMLDSHFTDNKQALEDRSRKQFQTFQTKFESDNTTKKTIARETEIQILNDQKLLLPP